MDCHRTDASSLGMIKYLKNMGNELRNMEGLVPAAMELKSGQREMFPE